jgi:membrane protease YdiL (CAAX protease family)
MGSDGGRNSSLQVVLFFVLTYVVTWTLFITAGSLSDGADGLRLPLLLVGTIAPSTVAVLLTARNSGGQGVRELLGRLLMWRAKLRWYLFAVGFFAAVKFTVALIYRIANGRWPTFGDQAWYAIVAAILVAWIFGGPLGEEIGWRGYALPRLTQRFGPALASVLLGLVWACWHLPLFFLSGQVWRSVRTVVPGISAAGHGVFGRHRVAGRQYRREPAPRCVDAFGDQPDEGHRLVCSSRRDQHVGVEHFANGVVDRWGPVDLRRVFPQPHAAHALSGHE